MSAVECLKDARHHIKDIFLHSGRYVFRLGQYNNCINKPHMDYYFLDFSTKDHEDSPAFYGCCLPRSCPNNTIQTLVNTVLGSVDFPYRVEMVRHQVDTFQFPYQWPFFIFIAIMTVLITLVLLATCSKTARQNKILNSFSIQSTSKIFKYHPNKRLNTFNGVKTLAMLWMVLGNAVIYSLLHSQNILDVQKNIMGDWRYLLLQAGLSAMNVFFFISAFLLAYFIIKVRPNTFIKYPLAMLDRVLRFLPSYFVAILIFFGVLPHLGSGPLWVKTMKPVWNCNPIWKPLLFVANLVDGGDNMCMDWGYFLQIDVQLYIFCVFMLLIYHKSKFASYTLIFLSIAASFAFVMTSSYQNKYHWVTHTSEPSQKYELQIYYKAWGRCPTYLYGLVVGILYAQFLIYQDKIKQQKKQKMINKQNETQPNNNKKIETLKQLEQYLQQLDEPIFHKIKVHFEKHPWHRRTVQVFGMALSLTVSLLPRSTQGPGVTWPQFVHAVYITYSSFFFVLGGSMTAFPSLIMSTNQNLLFRFLTDTKAFNFLAKVSFWCYLIHPTLYFKYYGQIKMDFYTDYVPVFNIFVSIASYSIIIATIFVFLVEAPFRKLHKMLLKRIQDNFVGQKYKIQEFRQIRQKGQFKDNSDISTAINSIEGTKQKNQQDLKIN